MTPRACPRSGVTLASALVGLFIMATAITLVLQTYVVGARSLRLTGQRDAVTAALEAQLETLRAAGYAKLPEVGARPIPPSALPALPGLRARLVVARGPVTGTRAVTAEATWDDRGPRQEALAMVMAQRGLNP